MTKAMTSLAIAGLLAVVAPFASGDTFVAATGGDLTWVGDNRVHTFTNSGTLTVTSTGEVQVLVVGGGGGGGSRFAGGGGAGGFIYSNAFAITAGVYTVTVGTGGAGDNVHTAEGGGGPGWPGNDSVFGTLRAYGGGYGANVGNGGDGGSGGGAGTFGPSGGVATNGQGKAGGSAVNGGSNYSGGGGGGAGGAGTNCTVDSIAGAGGPGVTNDISGSWVWYAAGGGGGTVFAGGTPGAGGSGGIGGAGGKGGNPSAGAGTRNTGSGGGGGGGLSSPGGDGGNGAAGIVIVRYQAAPPDMAVLETNGLIIRNQAAASAAQGTDFGAVALNLTIDHIFTVTNSGAATLNLTDSPAVSISGDSDFTVAAQPAATTLAVGDATPFTLRFQPQATGTRTALVSIANGTADLNPYTFALRGVTKPTWYVAPAPAGNDANDGTSWAAAKATIAGGIAVASAGDLVLVSNGVYTLSAEIALNKGVTVQGASGNPADVVVNGGGAVRGFNVSAAGATIQDLTITNGYASANGGGVYASVVLTLRNCVISGNRASNGGGVYCSVNFPIVDGCVIQGNQATAGSGGGLYSYYGTIQNSTFSGNTASGNGGGVWSFISSFIGCSFLTNTAAQGGGVWDDYFGSAQGPPVISGCVFRANQATAGVGGGMRCVWGQYQDNTFIANSASGDGGGGYLMYSSGAIQNNTFIDNHALGNGGGVWSYMSSFFGCSFLTNSAAQGGGVWADYYGSAEGPPVITGCVFRANQATAGVGGGMRCIWGQYQDNTFSANSAAGDGGGGYLLYVSGAIQNNAFIGNHASGNGGGVKSIQATFSGCSFLTNTAAAGGGIHSHLEPSAYVVVTGCVFRANQATGVGGGAYIYNGLLQDSDFAGNTAAGNGGGAYIYSEMYASRCSFSNNVASGAGGAWYANWVSSLNSSLFVGNEAALQGGGVCGNPSQTQLQTLDNCTLTENMAGGKAGSRESSLSDAESWPYWSGVGPPCATSISRNLVFIYLVQRYG